MKKHFLTGLAILLPLGLTILICLFLLNLFTAPFAGFIEPLLHKIPHPSFDFFQKELVIKTGTKILTLILFSFGLILIGFIVERLALHSLVHLAERIFTRIPLVNKIYHAIKEVVHSIFSEKKEAFGSVVLIPFPDKHSLSIGLLTRDTEILHPVDQTKLISVFVPASPNPTMGFMLLFTEDEVKKTNLTVEEAMKGIISCGAMLGNHIDD